MCRTLSIVLLNSLTVGLTFKVEKIRTLKNIQIICWKIGESSDDVSLPAVTENVNI